jgi:hypothetical protein
VTALRSFIAGSALALVIGGCGSRSPYWDTPVGPAASYGLANGVALVDDSAHRVVLLTALGGQQLAKQTFPIGHNVLAQATVTSPDGSRLFVLSAGDSPRRTETDQYPELSVISIDPTTFATTLSKYTMSVPLPNLAIDPLGHWAVAYSGPGAPATFVENANEVVIFDLTNPGSTPTTHTIRSQGGTPQQLTFTPKMNLSKVPGDGRLLVVETNIDVTLVELANPASDVTISLTSGTSAQQVTPAGVVVDSGFDTTNATAAPTSPRIALRAQGNTNVFTFTLGPSDTDDYTPIINVIDVGGVPSDIAFVRVDQDLLRVAALVPSTTSAVLADSDDGNTTQVALPAAYSNLSLVTSAVGSAGTDVAMLWSPTAPGVALWTLGNTVGQPYHSIEVLPITQQVQQVDEVAQQTQLKVLETTGAGSANGGFLVLDLVKETASPLQTTSQATLSIAPDGKRLWAFAQGGTDLAQIDFDTLNPVPLTTEEPIDAVYDVQRPAAPSGDGGRSLIAIHNQGTIGATVFDALNPDTATARIVPALLLEGP